MFVSVSLISDKYISVSSITIADENADENADDMLSFALFSEGIEVCTVFEPSAHVLTNDTYATRNTVSRCAEHNARAVIFVKADLFGKSMGSIECRKHIADSLVHPYPHRWFVLDDNMQ